MGVLALTQGRMTHSNIGASYRTFADMLLSDVADRHRPAITVHDGVAEDLLGHENALRMVSKTAMAKIRKVAFRLIEPVMNRL